MSAATAPGLRQLLTVRVGTAADTLRRGAALRLRREHDLSLSESRVLWMIDAMQPVRLRDIAADAGADKAQVSRIVTSLVKQGLVERRSIKGDARSAMLLLTVSGKEKLAAVSATVRERDTQLRSAIKPSEAEALFSILDRLTARARDLIDTEERLQRPAGR